MLNTTVRNNMILSSHIDDITLRGLIKKVKMEADLDKLPMGLETEVIEQGKNLTNIQKKKIGLIRSICSGSDTIVIDDIFSGMDGKEQLKIFNSLFSRSKSRSVIYTTENLDLIRKADKIIVMKLG